MLLLLCRSCKIFSSSLDAYKIDFHSNQWWSFFKKNLKRDLIWIMSHVLQNNTLRLDCPRYRLSSLIVYGLYVLLCFSNCIGKLEASQQKWYFCLSSLHAQLKSWNVSVPVYQKAEVCVQTINEWRILKRSTGL